MRSGSARSGLPAKVLAWVPGLALLSTLNTGYRFYCDNHALLLPRVKTFLDPSLFPDDPFVETLANLVLGVWWLVAQLSRWIDLEHLLLVLFLLTRCLLVYSCARLGAAFFPRSRLAPWAGAVLGSLAPKSLLGDGSLTEVYFEQTSLYTPFFLLAVAGYLDRRPTSFVLLAGLAFVINPLYGSWAALFFVMTYVCDPHRPQFGRLRRGALLFLLLLIPVLAHGLRVLLLPHPSPDLWIWVIRLLNSPHVAPETWDRLAFGDVAILSAMALGLALALGKGQARLSTLLAAWTGFAGVSIMLGFVAIESPAFAPLLAVQPFRATDLFCLPAGVALVSAASAHAEAMQRTSSWLVSSILFLAVCTLLTPGFRESAVLVIVLSAVCLLVATAGPSWVAARSRDRRTSTAKVAAGLLLASTAVGAAVVELHARTEKLGSLEQALYRGPDAQVLEVANWARTSTPRRSIFFHDPISWEWAQFRYLAERPVFVTWKDGSAAQWAPAYAEEWEERFAALGFKGRWSERWDVTRRGEISRIRQSLKRRYGQLTEEDVRALGTIDYWVAPRRARASSPVVFVTGKYKVVRLVTPQSPS